MKTRTNAELEAIKAQTEDCNKWVVAQLITVKERIYKANELFLREKGSSQVPKNLWMFNELLHREGILSLGVELIECSKNDNQTLALMWGSIVFFYNKTYRWYSRNDPNEGKSVQWEMEHKEGMQEIIEGYELFDDLSQLTSYDATAQMVARIMHRFLYVRSNYNKNEVATV